MKGILLYFLLAGMVLIHIPRTVLHECEHHSHSCDHEENQNEQNTDLSFILKDLCMYAFNALDAGSELILPDVSFSCESPINSFSLTLSSSEDILLRASQFVSSQLNTAKELTNF